MSSGAGGIISLSSPALFHWQLHVSFIRLQIKNRNKLLNLKKYNKGQWRDYELVIKYNQSNSKYIARMDSDDISHPLRFEKQINFLENNKKYVAVGSRVELINEEGVRLSQVVKFYENDSEIRKALKYRMPLCHPAMMFRAETLKLNKGYLYGNSAEDHELFIRITRDKNCLFKNLPDNLLSYRRHDNQLTNIKHARKAYCNISGFMFTELMLTGNFMYLLGIFSYHPILRRIRLSLRRFKELLK